MGLASILLNLLCPCRDWVVCLLFGHVHSCSLLQHYQGSPIPEGLQQYGEGCDGRTVERLHEKFFGRWEGGVEVLLWRFSCPFVGARKLSLLVEGGVYPQVSKLWVPHSLTTGDSGLFLLELATPPTQSEGKSKSKSKSKNKNKIKGCKQTEPTGWEIVWYQRC